MTDVIYDGSSWLRQVLSTTTTTTTATTTKHWVAPNHATSSSSSSASDSEYQLLDNALTEVLPLLGYDPSDSKLKPIFLKRKHRELLMKQQHEEGNIVERGTYAVNPISDNPSDTSVSLIKEVVDAFDKLTTTGNSPLTKIKILALNKPPFSDFEQRVLEGVRIKMQSLGKTQPHHDGISSGGSTPPKPTTTMVTTTISAHEAIQLYRWTMTQYLRRWIGLLYLTIFHAPPKSRLRRTTSTVLSKRKKKQQQQTLPPPQQGRKDVKRYDDDVCALKRISESGGLRRQFHRSSRRIAAEMNQFHQNLVKKGSGSSSPHPRVNAFSVIEEAALQNIRETMASSAESANHLIGAILANVDVSSSMSTRISPPPLVNMDIFDSSCSPQNATSFNERAASVATSLFQLSIPSSLLSDANSSLTHIADDVSMSQYLPKRHVRLSLEDLTARANAAARDALAAPDRRSTSLGAVCTVVEMRWLSWLRCEGLPRWTSPFSDPFEPITSTVPEGGRQPPHVITRLLALRLMPLVRWVANSQERLVWSPSSTLNEYRRQERAAPTTASTTNSHDKACLDLWRRRDVMAAVAVHLESRLLTQQTAISMSRRFLRFIAFH